MHNPKVAIVILNWNGAKLLRQFLPSVIAFSRNDFTEIIVADNGSTDDSLEMLRSDFPEVKILDLKKNYGFARGYNEALKHLDADYFVILNSDVEVTPGWLESPIYLMEANPETAAVQPKVLSYNKKTHFEYAGAAGGFIDRFGYPFCRGRIFNEVEADSGQYDNLTDIFWATGACMFVRASLFHQVGGFDADFWAHMEEIDLCWRARHLGFQIFASPESVVFHLGGGTLKYNSPLKIHLNFRNNLFLLFKNLPGKQLAILLPARMVLDGLAAFVFLFKGEFGSFRRVLSAHLKFYLHIPALMKKRRNIFNTATNNSPRIMSNKSIVWNYFVLKRRKYSDIR